MTSLTTHIEADPAALRSVATWLRTGLGSAIETAETALIYARTDRGAWTGEAAEAFRARMGTIARSTQDVGASVHAAAAALDAFASEIDQALADVAVLRAEAQTAGLTVTATAVLAPPSPGPAPQYPGPGATSADLHQYASAQSLRSRALHLADAYVAADASMTAVLTRLGTASATLEEACAALEQVTIPTIDFAAGAFISARVAQGIAALRGHARWLLESADLLEANARLPGSGAFPNQLYDDLDRAGRLRTQSAAALDDAARLARAGRVAGPVAGILLTGAAIRADIAAGESTEQAVTSNAVGLGASIAAGAATGAILGTVFPGLGNVAGAVIGAGVGTVTGIITSGMVDSFFENGPDVGAALANGWNDVVSTGAAVVDLAGAGIGAAGDALDAIGGGLADAWEGLFG